MTADTVLLQYKYDSVIHAFAERSSLSLRDAMDIFYKSLTYKEMREGISDMHCRSDEYLAEEIERELAAAEFNRM
jgi:hypothetical protein